MVSSQGHALHVGRQGQAKVLEQRGGQVDGLRQGRAALVPAGAARIPDKERAVGDLAVKGLDALGPPVVLAEQKAVVGVDDEHGVVPEVVLVHQVEDLAQPGVAHAERGGVFHAHVLDLLGRFLDRAVGRPVKVGAVVVMGVERLVVLLPMDKNRSSLSPGWR